MKRLQQHKRLLSALLVLAALIHTAGTALAAPNLVNFQGRVLVGGAPFDSATAGNLGLFKFALVDAGGTVTYWSNDGTSVAGSEPAVTVSLTVKKGLYTVLLGDSTLPNMAALPDGVFNKSNDVFLRVWFNDGTLGSQLLAPDQQIVSVASAMALAPKSNRALAIGGRAGDTGQGPDSVAIGESAGRQDQSPLAVAVGRSAGETNQGFLAVAIGESAGRQDQSPFAVAIGRSAGGTAQGDFAVAIGESAGRQDQSPLAVAIGRRAGLDRQGFLAVAIGERAGLDSQGSESVAIGSRAGETQQHPNSIVLNATGLPLNTTAPGGLYVKPIREAATPSTLHYDPATGEVTYSGGALSDINKKDRFAQVDAGEILDKVAALEIQTWVYKGDSDDRRHIGPIAQHFHQAFGLGDNDTTISTVDADGVALAAIKGLNHKVEAQNQSLRDENADLRKRLEHLEQAILNNTSN